MLILWLDHYGYRHMCCGKEMRHDMKIEGSCGWVCFQSHNIDIIISIVKSRIHGFQVCQESCRVKKLNNVNQLCPIIQSCPTWCMLSLKLFCLPHLLLLKSCHELFKHDVATFRWGKNSSFRGWIDQLAIFILLSFGEATFFCLISVGYHLELRIARPFYQEYLFLSS